jgi:hypothetical protein
MHPNEGCNQQIIAAGDVNISAVEIYSNYELRP